MDVKKNNALLLSKLSNYLNNTPRQITTRQVQKVMKCQVSELTAFILLLEYYLDVEEYAFDFENIVHSLDVEEYEQDLYYKNIKFVNKKYRNWQIKKDVYQAYECFVMDDFKIGTDETLLPQIGYFNKPFYFPCVLQDQRLWMSVTPNEINTMKDAIKMATGNVLTFGLGLGYFAYHCSLKENVSTITIVEKDSNVIQLFVDYILPQFEHKDKVHIITQDAFTFLDQNMKQNEYDYLFIDIWHDVSDGLPLYKRFKSYENKFPNTKFSYWIEKTIQYYLR